MLAGTIFIPLGVKELTIVIETRQTMGVKSKSLYVVLLRFSKETLGPDEHRF